MKTLLLCPPPGDLSQPYVALPALTAALRATGREVTQRDLNPEFFAYLRRPAIYRALRQAVQARVGLSDGDSGDSWNDPSRALLLNDEDTARLEQAVQVLHDPVRYYRPEEFSEARRRVRLLYRLVSAAHHPWELDLFRLAPPISPLLPVDEVLRLLDAPEGSPFHRFFVEEVVAGSADHTLVGISVTYGQQIVPALHLARLFRQHRPEVKIVLGGAALTCWHETFRSHPELFDLVDGVVIGDGERALLGFVEACERGLAPDGVPNLLRRVDGAVVQSGPSLEEDLASHATPDYQGLPLADYLVPEPSLLVPLSRGCSWGRCAFCNFDALRCSYRERPVERVIEDLATLQDRHGARVFYLAGNTVRAATLAKLAEGILTTGRELRWVVELRLDRNHRPEIFAAMHRSGCRLVLFGLESASQRVQDRMNKGYRVEGFAPILAAAAGAGLRVGIESFIGFPGETEQDARATADYLIAHQDEVTLFTLGTFVLDPNSLVARRPEEFGVRIAGPRFADTFARYLPFVRTEPGALDESRIQALDAELYDRLAQHFPYTLERFGQGIGGPDPTLYAIRYPTSFFHERPEPQPAPELPRELRALLALRPTWERSVVLRRLTWDPFSPPPAAWAAAAVADPEDPDEDGATLVVREEDASYLALAPQAGPLLAAIDGERSLAEVLRQGGLATDQALELVLAVADEGYLRLAK